MAAENSARKNSRATYVVTICERLGSDGPVGARARSASRGIAGCDRLEGHGSSVTETASSETDCTRDSAADPASNRNRASQRSGAIRRTRPGFPCPERMAATRPRCRQSAEAAAGSPSREARSVNAGARLMPDAICSSGRSLRLGKSTIDHDAFGRSLMLPATNLPVASLLIPLTWTHSLDSSRRNSLPPDQTASGPRAGSGAWAIIHEARDRDDAQLLEAFLCALQRRCGCVAAPGRNGRAR